jgi:xanthine dehydrogenase YagS FAD-binding subunit
MDSFSLSFPTSLDDAIARLPEDVFDGSVQLMAGGQDLLTELKAHLKAPDEVVSLAGLPGLDRIQPHTNGTIAIGALVTLDALEADGALPPAMQALAEAARSIASPQIRSVGTVGGNLNQRPRCWYYRHEAAPCLKKGGAVCFAKDGKNKYNAIFGGGPSYIVHPSDLAPALVALNASVLLSGPDGERRMQLEDYYYLPREGPVAFETRRRANEVLTSVEIPVASPTTSSTYVKFKERSSYDWALSSVALALDVDKGTVRSASLVLGGVAPKPWRAAAAEALLVGARLADVDDAAVARAALRGAEPLSDNAYKVPLTEGLVRRAIRQLS